MPVLRRNFPPALPSHVTAARFLGHMANDHRA